MSRKSPVRHTVGSHARKSGTKVGSYQRGSGKRGSRKKIVGEKSPLHTRVLSLDGVEKFEKARWSQRYHYGHLWKPIDEYVYDTYIKGKKYYRVVGSARGYATHSIWEDEEYPKLIKMYVRYRGETERARLSEHDFRRMKEQHGKILKNLSEIKGGRK